MATHSELTPNGKLIAEAIVKALQANGFLAFIDKTYLDYGQDWTWDTIIVKSKTGHYQALNPRQFKDMNEGTFMFYEIDQIVSDARKLNA